MRDGSKMPARPPEIARVAQRSGIIPVQSMPVYLISYSED